MMKAFLPKFFSALFPALVAAGSMGVIAETASAESKWTRPNSPSPETLALLSMDGSLSAETPVRIAFTHYSDVGTQGSAVNPAEPEFSEGPPSMGKALKLNTDNLLRLSSFKSSTPLTLTVSFWAKISEAGHLCAILNPGGNEENTLAIGLKVRQDGKLVIMAKLGTSKWVNQVVPSDLLTDTWQHLAVVVAPDAGGAVSKLTVSVDGQTLWEGEMDGVGPGRFTVTLGPHPYEYYLERGGPGAKWEVDELLVVEKALPDPHKPL